MWGQAWEQDTQTLRTHVANLRRKIESDPAAPRFIRTDPGVGYRFARTDAPAGLHDILMAAGAIFMRA